MKKLLLVIGIIVALYGLVGIIADYRDTIAFCFVIVGTFLAYIMWVWGYVRKCPSKACGRYWAAQKTSDGTMHCKFCGHEIVETIGIVSL